MDMRLHVQTYDAIPQFGFHTQQHGCMFMPTLIQAPQDASLSASGPAWTLKTSMPVEQLEYLQKSSFAISVAGNLSSDMKVVLFGSGHFLQGRRTSCNHYAFGWLVISDPHADWFCPGFLFHCKSFVRQFISRLCKHKWTSPIQTSSHSIQLVCT